MCFFKVLSSPKISRASSKSHCRSVLSALFASFRFVYFSFEFRASAFLPCFSFTPSSPSNVLQLSLYAVRLFFYLQVFPSSVASFYKSLTCRSPYLVLRAHVRLCSKRKKQKARKKLWRSFCVCSVTCTIASSEIAISF